MIDAVLGYHTNPHTCGVAKFNQRLARELGVPCLSLGSSCQHPMLSIKPQEMPRGVQFFHPDQSGEKHPPFDLFLHGESDAPYLVYPERVYAANRVIADAVRPYRPDVIEAWCPSTVEGNAHRGAINVLTFGMASKLTSPYYEKLKALLDATGTDYTVCLSCAIHEGNPWDVQMAETETRMRAVFGDHLRVLGYLADDALVAEMARSTAVAAFYDPAVRHNNTSFHAAVESGKPVITNSDDLSPRMPFYDISEMNEWPKYLHKVLAASANEQWQRLIGMFQGQPCAK